MDAPTVWIVIALCFNVLILAVGAMSGKKDRMELRLRVLKSELKAELMENMVNILISKKQCSCKDSDEDVPTE